MKTRTTKTFLLSLLGAISLAGTAAHAEDIDIYGAAAANGPKPNIIIAVDNRAGNNADITSTCAANSALSGTKLLNLVQCALYTAVDDIRNQKALLGKFNLGLMTYTPGSVSALGGYWIVPGSPPLTTNLPTMDLTGIANFETLVSTPLATANNGAASSAMQESYAFFTGHTGLSGNSYSSHMSAACQKSFVIFIGASAKQGSPEDGGSQQYQSALQAAGATTAQMQQIYLGGASTDQSAWSDEWARFMYQTNFGNDASNPENIVTYTIAAGGSVANYNQLLQSMADQGGGKAFVASDVNSMVQALLQIFNEVQAVNSVFASSSLPISANTQGTYQNQVFIGMFRPDGSANPRWMGNLKQYQFGVSTSGSSLSLFLADALGKPAINSAGTGFLSPTAVSFWNPVIDPSTLPDSIGGFWVNRPQGAAGGYDNPDGEIVEKGGVGQQIRLANLQDNYVTNPTGPRNVYTCTGASGSCANGSLLSATPFATTNTDLTSAAFNVTAPSTPIATFSRSGTTVTATLATAPSPALTNGQTVTIQGASSIELNGTYSIALVNPTTFTYTISENPPSPSSGSYTATSPASSFSISSLTRVGTTVTATTSAAHSYIAGNSVTISGASGSRYNGTFTVTNVPSPTTFTYTITDGPGAATAGGTADVGTTHTAAISFPSSNITRDATHSDNTSTVTISVSSGTLNSAYAVGAKVNVSGVTPSDYNVTLATITGIGTACPGGSNKKSFCYSINTTPASPDASATATVGTPAKSVTISSLSHSVACTGTTPTNLVTVTANATGNPFNSTDFVNIAGNPVGAGESAYVGTFNVLTAASGSFTYQAATSPSCAPSAAGASAITSTTGVDVTSLINWVRGDDNVGDEPSPGSGITIRPSVHGDVLHSRPAVVNYGTPYGVVVFYGANDGTFRAINGNQPGGITIASATPGQEIWSFVAPEFFSELPRLYQNSPSIKLATTPDGIIPTPQPKDYFFDGSTGVYQNGSTVDIFMSARRGGRFIYALDVSNPATPRLLWKKSSADTGLGEMGYTWSLPKPARVRGYANPVLIFGGGYDTNEDNEPPTADTMGRGVFILDALDGHVVWSATYGSGATGTCTGTCTLSDMTYAIPADVTLVNRDFDPAGYVDRLYAADLGGNIWRVDLEPAGYTADPSLVGPSTWQITKFAALGGTGTTKRKFFFPPDIVATKTFDMILAGTGDREHPLYSSNTSQAYSIVNRFYGLKDLNTGSSVPAGWSNSGSTPGTNAPIVDATSSTANNTVTGLTTVTSTTTYDPTTSNNGFYLTFPNAGEKAVNAPTTVGGFTYIGTNTPQLPSSDACSTLGVARGYQINFLTGASKFTTFANGGLPPSPVAGLVDVTVDGTDRLVPFCLGCGNPDGTGADATSSIGGGKPPIPVPPVRKRVYWYLDKHDN
ncbi:MAG TPA: hypothetical protein VLU54_15825 [Casimicrobiaceae bacterium]|nr:hypothetical protein [Casimicrobiaceae bacterium]